MPNEIEEIRKILQEHDKRITDLEKRSSTHPPEDQKELTVREFMIQQNPKNDVQKSLLIGYYLENFRGISPFNLNDLKTVFNKAKEPLPPNLNDKVNMNIAKGYLAEADEKKDSKKAWFVTQTGKKAVEDGLNKQED
jgi:hypothetical protein